MLRRLSWALVLITIAVCVVVFSEGFALPYETPTPTAYVEPSATPIPTEYTVEPTTEVTVPVEATATSVPPTEIPPTVVPPTATLVPTSTITSLPPTATFTPTAIPPTATFTPTVKPPTATATATAIVEKFTIQGATPIFLVNFVHPTEACNWQGVAGQIFDVSSMPLMNYVVKVAGIYNGAPFTQIGITGMVTGNPYGVGGYEIVLGNKAITSIDLLTIQVFDNQGKPVTNPMPFSTSATCSQNLVLINFTSK